MWKDFWLAIFFLTFAGFCIISVLIAWKGVGDLKHLFSRLRDARDRAADRPAGGERT